MSDKVVVITKRCIDISSYGYDIDKRPCSECGEMTWLSKSWRRKKIDQIICDKCLVNSKEYKNDDYIACTTEECLEEAVQWVRNHFDTRETDEVIKEKIIQTIENKIGKMIKIR